jgi:hypothetical protein
VNRNSNKLDSQRESPKRIPRPDHAGDHAANGTAMIVDDDERSEELVKPFIKDIDHQLLTRPGIESLQMVLVSFFFFRWLVSLTHLPSVADQTFC